MTTRPILLATLAASTLLAACGTPNRGLESVHQPVVSRQDYAFDVAIGADGLAPGEPQRLDGWMESLRVGYGDTVALDNPYGGAGRAAADVAAVAARRGLLLAEAAPVTGAPIAPGTLRVVVSRARASVPNCPDYSRVYEPNFNAHTGSNYGCATNTNLAAMVADPNDLVRGATRGGETDAVTATRAIAAMRAQAPTGNGGTWVKNKAEQTTGGNQ
jgi:pilus assembly protein CpaD